MDQLGYRGQSTTLVHFSQVGEAGERVACMPGMTEFHLTPHHPNYQRSNDPRAVTCPACKRTDAYRGVVDAYPK